LSSGAALAAEALGLDRGAATPAWGGDLDLEVEQEPDGLLADRPIICWNIA
jgi:hypothetical protein